jgi:formylglycine-generating enzyme required for sulfatase activity
MDSVDERWWVALVAACWSAMLACSPAGAPTPEQAAGTPTQIAIDLPPGVLVDVDGAQRGMTPLGPVTVTAGDHVVALRSSCQRADVTVQVTEAETTTVDRRVASALEFATFVPRAESQDGRKLDVRLFADGDEVGEVAHGASIDLPACKLRVAIRHGDLGGYIEDLDLRPASLVTRDVVLGPGSDMVRIHGASFTTGVPPHMEDLAEYGVNRVDVEVDDFVVDRSEVTASQFRACRQAAMENRPKGSFVCRSDQECAAMGACYPDARKSAARPIEGCNYAPSAHDDPVRVGRGDHPMNCVARWEAELYCAWVGKRLATEVEWEFAARSTKLAYGSPCGGGEGSCYTGPAPEPKWRDTHAVCRGPYTETEQGLCDMASNVREWVAGAPGSLGDGVTDVPVRGGYFGPESHPVFVHGGMRPQDAATTVGFRCARSVPHEESARAGARGVHARVP